MYWDFWSQYKPKKNTKDSPKWLSTGDSWSAPSDESKSCVHSLITCLSSTAPIAAFRKRDKQEKDEITPERIPQGLSWFGVILLPDWLQMSKLLGSLRVLMAVQTHNSSSFTRELKRTFCRLAKSLLGVQISPDFTDLNVLQGTFNWFWKSLISI